MEGFVKVNLDLFQQKEKIRVHDYAPPTVHEKLGHLIDDSDLEIKLPDYSRARTARERHLLAMSFIYQNRVYLDELEKERGIKHEETET